MANRRPDFNEQLCTIIACITTEFDCRFHGRLMTSQLHFQPRSQGLSAREEIPWNEVVPFPVYCDGSPAVSFTKTLKWRNGKRRKQTQNEEEKQLNTLITLSTRINRNEKIYILSSSYCPDTWLNDMRHDGFFCHLNLYKTKCLNNCTSRGDPPGTSYCVLLSLYTFEKPFQKLSLRVLSGDS